MLARNRIIVQVALILLMVGFAGWYFSNVLTYLLLAIIISTILNPVADFMQRLHLFGWRLPRALVIALSFLVLLGLFAGLSFAFVPLIVDQVEVIAQMDFQKTLKGIEEPLHTLEQYLIRYGLTDRQPGFLFELLKEGLFNTFYSMEIGQQILNDLLVFTGEFFVGLVAVAFITFFLMYEKGLLKNSFLQIVPNAYFEMAVTALYQIERTLSSYLTGLILEILSMFTLISVGLTLIGIEYALSIALFASVIHLIPYLGGILGLTFGILVGVTTAPAGLASEAYLFLALKILAVQWGILVMDNVMLQPMIFSKSMKAHPLEIFIAVFLGGALGGAVGMIASIPGYTILKVTVSEVYRGYRNYRVFRPQGGSSKAAYEGQGSGR